ncbi:hypothetical protein [uncultured Cellulomonas sp.]|uniref:hypothetical protein n=1 Tax=uncultured Cellulomonas sp. TaxID=189682 RepID=UPI0028E62359|nr:hypothetical protein [uncultured Cellulomonas sp.]
MSDTGRPGPDRPIGQPVPPISNWQAQPPTPPSGPVQGDARTGVPSSFAVPATTGSEPPPEQATGRPRWLIPAIIGAVVLIAAAIIIGIVVSSGGDDTVEQPPAVAETTVLPSPTPTVAPAARPATSAFASALPVSVLQYALATSGPDAEWQAAGALEAYTETYTDGADGTLTVRSGQWETPAEAVAYAAALVAGLPAAPSADPSASPSGPTLPSTGEVTAGDAAAGTFTIADASDGTGVAVWTNGTTVFRATAPLADIVNVYNAFPL